MLLAVALTALVLTQAPQGDASAEPPETSIDDAGRPPPSADAGTALAPFVLRGRVVGALGEPLEGAQVQLEPKSTLTDAKGAFTLTFEAPFDADSWVTVTKPGYALKAFPEVFQPGRITEVKYLLPKERLNQTIVRGSRLLPPVPEADRTPQVSHFSINRGDIDRTPGALEDISRVVQRLPGVAADPDLLASFFVRGGAPDEVLFSIDGVPLSNPYHLGGFASIINPQLVESADFYAGGSPARYEPTLSGTLEVHYPSVEATKFHLVADLSIQTAKVRADIPLGVEGLSMVVSFRRSYFELYFAALKAFNVFGQNVVAPDITELFGRVIFRRGKHRTMATFINASDGLDFVIKPGEEVLVNFAGGLKLANNAMIASLNHTIDLGGDRPIERLNELVFECNDLVERIGVVTLELQYELVLHSALAPPLAASIAATESICLGLSTAVRPSPTLRSWRPGPRCRNASSE